MSRAEVAWVGLGTMGAAMAGHLQRAGVPLAVWNRTRARLEPFERAGAMAVATPAEAARAAPIVFVRLGSPEALIRSLEGPDGILAGLSPGSLVVDMATDGPSAVLQADAAVRGRGASLLDAPVLGSRGAAEAATLVAMAGGSAADLERARPYLERMASAVVPVGDAGDGQRMKLATNTVIQHMLAGLASAVGLAAASGVSPRKLVDALDAGLKSPFFRAKGTLMIEGSFQPDFTIDLVLKDNQLIRREMERAGLPGEVMVAIGGLMNRAAAEGWGDLDGSVLSRLFGVPEPPGPRR